MNYQEAQAAWQADKAMLIEQGVICPSVHSYVADEFRRDYTLAMDAMGMDATQAHLVTTPSAGIPAVLTTMIDPTVFRVIFAPTRAAAILGEVKKGTWIDDTAIFPVVEQVGEVSSYGDFNNNGHTGVNTGWPNRQAYLFQTIKEYGERELERAGLARINWMTELDVAAATVMQRFLNYTYFFGVQGMQNYGLLNDPLLSAPLTPGLKAYDGGGGAGTGITWSHNGAIMATANEIFADIQALYAKLVAQTFGYVDQATKLVLAMSPGAQVALTATNSFGVSVYDLLKKNFPNIRIETAVQYGAKSVSNPQGVAGGEYMQLIAEEIEGQPTGYCAFNEKMRQHAIVPDISSWKQKVSGGTWGTIIRLPMAISSMVGV